ncbi:adenosylcobinamide-phosphate synthase CbiB [Geobacter sp. DSM 9736]|uniref:adenosylcobinamide-phosphate synthase CbiB n=1 Tax=Geobacter sp. DSM 9736 TaxID=1277350 RepID=UPI000B508D7D|nr:adenosylcobinamide-phosphate synthase CbiB [Geobacter sp. DSM 9736]SNB46972.1 adenosylcobinamide-phosphate synthase [Geobacter sp. DSM 9736]
MLLFAPDILVVTAAVLLDLIIGDPRWMPHPVVYIGKIVELLERVLRRLRLPERFAGVLLLVGTVSMTVGTAFALTNSVRVVHPWAAVALSIFFAWSCLAARSLHSESQLVARALERGDLAAARRHLSFIVGRDTEDLSEPEIWRALVETVAENTSDGVVAPLIFLMLGGPLLALGYKAVNTLDSMVGYRNERYLKLGWASARFDDVVNYVPARITGFLMVMAAPLVGLSGKQALRMMFRDGRNHSSPNSGVPEAAAAGALGVQLGGTNRYGGVPVAKPTIGDPDLPLSPRAYRGAVRLMYAAEGLLLVGWLLVVAVTCKYCF